MSGQAARIRSPAVTIVDMRNPEISRCVYRTSKSLAALTNRLVTVRCTLSSATESSIQSSDRLVTPAAENMTTTASRAN